jgi:hypothetical protein
MITIPSIKTAIWLHRAPTGELLSNVPHTARHHSPNGFEIGYRGSGPTELALNILNQLLPVPRRPRLPEVTDQWTPDDWKAFDHWQQSIVNLPNGGSVSRNAWELRCSFRDQFLSHVQLEPGQSRVLDIDQIAHWIERELANL